MGKTLFEKIWDAHVVRQEPDGVSLLYVDLHLVHEVTSPQAFDGLRLHGRRVRRPDLTVATMDHNVPTDTLPMRRPKAMRVRFVGRLPLGVTAKDAILATIGRIGVGGGAGHAIEYAGELVEGLSMEGRMTICNMSIEGGARAGMIAPDDTTFAYL